MQIVAVNAHHRRRARSNQSTNRTKRSPKPTRADRLSYICVTIRLERATERNADGRKERAIKVARVAVRAAERRSIVAKLVFTTTLTREPTECHQAPVLPLMSGRQLAVRLLTLRPDNKVVFMSGYTDYAVLRRSRASCVLCSNVCLCTTPSECPCLLQRRPLEVIRVF